MDRRRRIVFVGSGNVATHLARKFSATADIVQVWSHNIDNAVQLARQLPGCCPVSDLGDIITDADLYLIAINDDRIADVARTAPNVSGIVAHTSGSTPMHVLRPMSARYGVFYPLQSFTKDAPTPERIPIFVEGCDSDTLSELEAIASEITDSVAHATSVDRATIHLAAVVAQNFSNLMWDCAWQIMQEHGLPPETLKPLLELSLEKATSIGPYAAQTGPAVRGDMAVIERHVNALPEGYLREMYRQLSQIIITRHNEQN